MKKSSENNEGPHKPHTDTIIRTLKIWRSICLWGHNSYELGMSCDVTSDFNLDFLAIGWSNRCENCRFLPRGSTGYQDIKDISRISEV